jgi:hypothetical protein
MNPMRQQDSVNYDRALDWMAEARQRIRAAVGAELLDFDGASFHGIDTFDALLSPIYVAVLNVPRPGKVAAKPRLRRTLERARKWAYRFKMALRDRRAAKRSSLPEPADVLLWSRHITHTVIQHPVAEAVRKCGASARLFACQVGVFEELEWFDHSTVFAPAVWPARLRRARRLGAARARRLAASGSWQLPPFRGHSGESVEAAVRHVMVRLLPLVSETVAATELALDTFRPKVLVVGNDLTFEGRLACRVAAQRGLPTAMFMHGTITGDPLQAMHCADRIFVNGTIHEKELRQQGIAADHITVCGAPNLDKRHKQTGQIHPRLQARVGLQPGRPWILVATSGPGHRISYAHHQTVIQNLAQLSHHLPDVPVIVKLHRKDRLEYYQGALDNAPHTLTLVAEESSGFPDDIFDWLEGCSVVLTGASAVAVEAMLMDVPVVSMDFCDEIHAVDFIDQGATTHVRTLEELTAAVSRILASGAADNRPRVQAYLERAYYALDGSSANRAAQSLIEMMQGNSPASGHGVLSADRGHIRT